MSAEQKFKRKAKEVVLGMVPEIHDDMLNGIVNDTWIWFVEHGTDMDEASFTAILKKNGVHK
jgi:hypothetical protein